jgi:hypothetical protein
MIKAPATVGYGVDVLEVGKREKLDPYSSFLEELEEQGIRYKPAVLSAFGRFHPDVKDMLKQAARRAAMRQEGTTERALYKRWSRDLVVLVWKRASAMVNKCLLHTAEQEINEHFAGDSWEEGLGDWKTDPGDDPSSNTW